MTHWKRIHRLGIACPVCGHKDWCLMSPDGSAVICGRIEQGAVRRCGQAGWLHRIADQLGWQPHKPNLAVAITAMPSPKLAEMAREFHLAAIRCGVFAELSVSLGLSTAALEQYQVGWCEQQSCTTWPMRDADGRVVGLNRRFADGHKMIFRGHCAGLYVPIDLPADLSGKPLLIAEGATDAVVGSDLGFWTVGRFSCSHGTDLLTALVTHRRPAEVVVVADGDEAGQIGADMLARAMVPLVKTLKIVTPPPPHKDLRAWKQAGATEGDLLQLIKSSSPMRLSVEVRT
jgi:hypothetical protein